MKIIKTIYILINILLFLMYQGQAQKLGYKEFQIGKQITDTTFKKYALREMKSDPTRYGFFPSDMSFCEMSLQLVLLHIDSLKSIDISQVHTEEISFKDYDAFQNKFFYTIDCMIEAFGKADMIDLDNKESKKIAFWDLRDVNVMLSLSVDNMSTFAKNEKRIFIITWSFKRKPKLW